MYQLVRGKPFEEIVFTEIKAKKGRYRNKMVCDDIFTFDTETTSDYIDENGKPFMFDYDEPEKAQNAIKHSLCYLWQFGINEDTRYIGRNLEDFALLLDNLRHYCPHLKIIYIHNLSFDFNFLLNVFKFDSVFARKPRHPMTARVNNVNVEFRCSFVLTNLKLETWATSNNLQARKKTGLLNYRQMRTPLTVLTRDEIDYSIGDLDVMYYGLLVYKNQYGHICNIPLTHTGKMREKCKEVMEKEYYYCEKVTKLMPQTLDEYVRQAHAFIGGSVFCNWLYKNRTIKENKRRGIYMDAYDITSSYPWVLINNKYPMSPFYKTTNYEKYMYNDKYVYLIEFECYGIESNYNCHFMSRSKALKIKGCETDNGRIIRADYGRFILTSVDYELFERLYTTTKVVILNFRWSVAKPLNNTFRKFILDLYVGKTQLKGVKSDDGSVEQLYQNLKENLNATYGDFVTKIFSDLILFDQNKHNVNGEIWDVKPLDDELFSKDLKSLNKKKYKNYKAFCQGIFVTAWARQRIWDAVLSGLDENIMYSDTDSLKVYNYKGSFFEDNNKYVLTRHKELAKELNIDITAFSPLDKKGNPHPLGVWDNEGRYKEFRSLGCKQYIYKDNDGLHLTCAGVSKLAVKAFNSVSDFKPDRRLTEKELKNCVDEFGHSAEKLIPFYSDDYPVITYPDGYKCRYKYGVCLMPTTFNLSITPNDMTYLMGEVMLRLNKSYYKHS